MIAPGAYCLVVARSFVSGSIRGRLPLANVYASSRGGSRLGSRSIVRRPISKRVWWVTGLLLGAGVYLVRPAVEGIAEGALARYAYWAFFAGLLGIAGLLAALVVLGLLRPRGRSVARALKLARSGQVAAAVLDLQKQIVRRGRSSRRCEALGDCYLLQEDWQAAYLQFLEAEELGGEQGRTFAKQGFALWKLGRATDAVGPLERVIQTAPTDPTPMWIYCHVLTDLGQVEAARERLTETQQLIRESIPPGTAQRRRLEESLEGCRQRLLLMSDVSGDASRDANTR